MKTRLAEKYSLELYKHNLDLFLKTDFIVMYNSIVPIDDWLRNYCAPTPYRRSASLYKYIISNWDYMTANEQAYENYHQELIQMSKQMDKIRGEVKIVDLSEYDFKGMELVLNTTLKGNEHWCVKDVSFVVPCKGTPVTIKIPRDSTGLQLPLVHGFIRRYLSSILKKFSHSGVFKGIGVWVDTSIENDAKSAHICTGFKGTKICVGISSIPGSKELEKFNIKLVYGPELDFDIGGLNIVTMGNGTLSIDIDDFRNITVTPTINLSADISYKNSAKTTKEKISFNSSFGMLFKDGAVEPIFKTGGEVSLGGLVKGLYKVDHVKDTGVIKVWIFDIRWLFFKKK